MAANGVTTIDVGEKKVARRAEVNAPAVEIFDLLADARRHGELDGSGTVNRTLRAPARLSQGAKFTVAMKQYGLPYFITSKVTAFDDGHVIEWRHPMGHRWRWELRETEPGKTVVTETFDYSGAKSAALLERGGFPAKNGRGIEKTLEALEARFA